MKASEHLRRASTVPLLLFQRKTERLDWKRIASLDIDKLVQDGDPNQLEEYISPVLFCKAESEFDSDRTDPGFIKVFRLSQLIGEYLLFCWETDKEKLKNSESKCTEMDVDKSKLVEEIGALRENLAGAKKELKKRRDLLALTQNEALGSSNFDEFDQCPYCPKRFLTPTYLQAHMQRRHQGLPPLPLSQINHTPYYPYQLQQQQQNTIQSQPAPNTNPVYGFLRSPNGTVKENNMPSEYHLQERRESSTQTLITIESEGEIRENGNGNISIKNSTEIGVNTSKSALSLESKTPVPDSPEVVTVIKSAAGILPGPPPIHTNDMSKKIDLNSICDLVGKYLEQKSVASQNQHYDMILSSIQQCRDQGDHYSGDSKLGSPMTTTAHFGGSLMKVGTSSRDDDGEDAGFGSKMRRMDEGNVTRLKDEFESQWRHLSEKVRESGIEELRGTFLSEIKKVQEIILQSPARVSELGSGVTESGLGVTQRDRKIVEEEGEVKTDSLEDKNAIDKVEERLRRQEEMMEEFRTNLQSKMEAKVENLKSQLDSQERLWHSKLQSLELEHKNEIIKLLQNPAPNNSNSKTLQPPLPHQTTQPGPVDKSIQEGLEIEDELINSPEEAPQSSLLNQSSIQQPVPLNSRNDILNINTTTTTGSRINEIRPVPKPRKTHTGSTSSGPPMEPDNSSGGSSSFVVQNSHPNKSQEMNPTNPNNDTKYFRVKPAFAKASPQFGILNQPDSEEEPEYLTVIQPESDQPPHINPATNDNFGAETGKRPGRNVSGIKAVTPQVHEYEEPLSVARDPDRVSDYTDSDDDLNYTDETDEDEEDYYGINRRPDGGDTGSYYKNSRGDHPTVGPNRVRRVNIVFDSENEMLVDKGVGDNEGGDLFRDRTLDEIDKRMEALGINPKAKTIGIEEMGQALKHLKATRASVDEDPEKTQEGREALKRDVNYESAKRSIHQKLDKYGASTRHQTGSSPFAKIFHKVKKSSTNLKTKVVSAMKPNPKSPSKKQKEPDIKTSFFSKSRWNRKDKKPDPENPLKPEDPNPPSESESDDSSVDLEMPPYMTKSGPILAKSDKQQRNVHKTETSETQDDYEDGNTELQSKSQNPPGDGVIREQNAKLHFQQTPNSPKKSSPGKKIPNFFVNGSPVSNQRTVAQVAVTSNGWSSRPAMPPNNSADNLSSTPFTNTNNTTTSTSNKKPFRRDLLKEFEEIEENEGKSQKNRKAMSIVQEEPEECSSSSISTTFVSGTGQADNNVRGNGDDDGGRIGGQSFQRLDDNRRGFRTRKSSNSDFSDDDGLRNSDNTDRRNHPEVRKRSVEEIQGQYVSLKYPTRPNSPPIPTAPELTQYRHKEEHSHEHNVEARKGQRSHFQYAEARLEKSQPDRPLNTDSDATSEWESHDDDDDTDMDDQVHDNKNKNNNIGLKKNNSSSSFGTIGNKGYPSNAIITSTTADVNTRQIASPPVSNSTNNKNKINKNRDNSWDSD